MKSRAQNKRCVRPRRSSASGSTRRARHGVHVAHAYEDAGDRENAVAYHEKYLASNPADRAAIEGKVAELKGARRGAERSAGFVGSFVAALLRMTARGDGLSRDDAV